MMFASSKANSLHNTQVHNTEVPRQLGSDQQRAVDAAVSGRCVFVTGGAGVGKSYTLHAVVSALTSRGRRVAVTASTGTAAINVDGTTIHSWAGLLDTSATAGEWAERIWSWGIYMDKYRSVDVLVLDEISMVDCELLEKVDYLLRYLRGCRVAGHPLFPQHKLVHELHPLPFAGLQVITIGDFFQLPPVDKENKAITADEDDAADECRQAGSSGQWRQPSTQLSQAAQQLPEASPGARGPDPDPPGRPGQTSQLGRHPSGGSQSDPGSRRSGGTASGAGRSGGSASGGNCGRPKKPPVPVVVGVLPPGARLVDPRLPDASCGAHLPVGQARTCVTALSSAEQDSDEYDMLSQLEAEALAAATTAASAAQASPQLGSLYENMVQHHNPAQLAELGVRPTTRSAADQLELVQRLVRQRPDIERPKQRKFEQQQPSLGLQMLQQPCRATLLQQSAPARTEGQLYPTDCCAGGVDKLPPAAAAAAGTAAAAAGGGYGDDVPAAAWDCSSSLGMQRPGKQVKQEQQAGVGVAAAVNQQPSLQAAGPCQPMWPVQLEGAAAVAAPGVVSGLAMREPLWPVIDMHCGQQAAELGQEAWHAECTAAGADLAAAPTTASQVDRQPSCRPKPAQGQQLLHFSSPPAHNMQSSLGATLAPSSSPFRFSQGAGPSAADTAAAFAGCDIQGTLLTMSGERPRSGDLRDGQLSTSWTCQGQCPCRPVVFGQLYACPVAAEMCSSSKSGAGAAGVPAVALTPGKAPPHSPSKAAEVGAAAAVTVKMAQDNPAAQLQPAAAAAGGPGLMQWTPGGAAAPDVVAAQQRSTTTAESPLAFETSPVKQPVSALSGVLSPTPAAAVSSTSSSSIDVPRLPVAWRTPAYRKGYCFKSPAWAAADFLPVVLKEPFRQSEPQLLNMLNEVRHGIWSQQTQQLLRYLARDLPTTDGIQPTELFATNREADGMNAQCYAALAGQEVMYTSVDGCDQPEVVGPWKVQQRLNDHTNALAELAVKQEAQVILLWNMDVPAGLANGTRGKVVGFAGLQDYLQQEQLRVRPCQLDAKAKSSSTSALPASISGINEARLEFDASCKLAGCCGHEGCACQSVLDWLQRRDPTEPMRVCLPGHLQWVELTGWGDLQPWKRLQVQQALCWLIHTQTWQLPVVLFTKRPRASPQELAPMKIIGPVTFNYKTTVKQRAGLPHAPVEMTRTMLPLRLAWALTVHRSQGMTITLLRVHLNRAFGAGMVYVALSRCVSLEGLQVVGSVRPPICNGDVKAFYTFVEQQEAEARLRWQLPQHGQ